MTLSNQSLKGRNGKSASMSEITIHDRIERFLNLSETIRSSYQFST